ncbi:MAG: GNAT family N-acetyltransferase [Candidatus Omnitrophota bacterium]
MSDASLYTVKVHTKISDLKEDDWNSVYPGVLEGYNFFKTADETLSHQFVPYYITIYEEGRMVCAAPCFAMDYPLDTTLEGPLKRLIQKLRSKNGRLFKVRALICGSPAGRGWVGMRGDKIGYLAEKLEDEMRSVARRERAGIIAFKDFTGSSGKIFPVLKKRGFHKIPSYPAFELRLPFKSFEEYFSTLSRATRKDLKRKFKKSGSLGRISMEVKSEPAELLDRIYELYLNTLKKSGVQFEILSKEFFERISSNMPGQTKYFLWFIDGKLAAFDLCLVSGSCLLDEYIGMDYDVAYKYHLYFVTFRDIINWCIANNIKVYQSGALNAEPKKRLDFEFIPQYVYARARNNLLNVFLGFLAGVLKPGEEGSLTKQ